MSFGFDVDDDGGPCRSERDPDAVLVAVLVLILAVLVVLLSRGE